MVMSEAEAIIATLDTPAEARNILELAIAQLKRRRPLYKLYSDYYAGNQDLVFSSPQYRNAFARIVAKLRMNICPSVVDSIADRLIVTGFEVEGGDMADERREAASPAWELWRENRMDHRAGTVHQEASRSGDAYVIVWFDAREPERVRIFPQDAATMTCHYDDNEVMDWAAKWWTRDDRYGRINLYFPDHIERYITVSALRNTTAFPNKITGFRAMQDGDEQGPTLVNTTGQVPVFHFPSNGDIGQFGWSDLRDVIPIQDGLNKTISDLLVQSEFMAFPQRWVTGIQTVYNPDGSVKPPFQAGVDRVWAAGDADVKFGEFGMGDLRQVAEIANFWKISAADVTGTPAHYMMMTPTDWPSGEALKTAEARFVAKIRDRQVSFGNIWEDVIKYALLLDGQPIEDRISTLWQDASPRSEKDMAEVAILKKQVGVSNEQLQREMGYSDEQIGRMGEESAEAAEAAMERMARNVNAGREVEEE